MIDFTLCQAPGAPRVHGAKPNGWTAAEDELMRSRYPDLGPTKMVPLLPGRSLKAIKLRAYTLKVKFKRYREWPAELDEAIRTRYPEEGGNILAAEQGVDPIIIRKRAEWLGVKKLKKPAPPPRPKGTKLAKPNNFGRIDPAHQALRKSAKKPVALPKQEVDRTPAKSTGKCKPFVDRRWLPDGPVPRVVDSAECRPWAKSA